MLCIMYTKFSVYIPWLVLHWGGIEPFRRGFHCDDLSLSYPYKSSTVPGPVMETLGFVVPAFFVSIASSSQETFIFFI